MSRRDPRDGTDERQVLVDFLDFHRELALHRVAALGDERSKLRLVASLTTPAGVINHLAAVERYWFRRVLAGDGWQPAWTKDDPDFDWRVAEIPLADIVADYALAVEQSNAVMAGMGLADSAAWPRSVDDRVNLRWVLVHMIEETAQHNGHLDILCEQISVPDGAHG
ncbi:MAG: DinB family protein [Candidatus Nanopelagicales bacterium]